METVKPAQPNPAAAAAAAQAQGVVLIPKFSFGVKCDVKNNVHFLDDQRIIYPCGHNIVIFNNDDKTQQYIPGIEGSEGITAMALSPSKKFMAVCERAERAICAIYDITTQRRRKILTSSDCLSKEYISVAFSNQSEKSHILTLSGEPDWMIILWQWDKSKCLAFQRVGVSGSQQLYQCSFNNQDTNSMVVTGNGVYKYYKMKDNGIKVEHP